MIDMHLGALLAQALEDRLFMIQDGTKSSEDPDTIDYIANLGYACIIYGGGDTYGSEKVTPGKCLDVEPMPENSKADWHDKR